MYKCDGELLQRHSLLAIVHSNPRNSELIAKKCERDFQVGIRVDDIVRGIGRLLRDGGVEYMIII